MKIWTKYLIGIVLGVVFTLVSSGSAAFFATMIDGLSVFVVQFGRYSLYPVLFFGLTVSVFNLREKKQIFRLSLALGGAVLFSAFLLAVFGLVSVLIRSPARIPIFEEAGTPPAILNAAQIPLLLFPSSPFHALIDGLYILPLCVFAGFAGAGCAVDKTASKPAVTLFDSLARVSYAVMVFFVDLLSIGVIALSAHWLIQFREVLASQVFTDFVILLFIDLFIVAVLVIPGIVKLFCPSVNPYRILYAGIAPAIIAFVSADTNATLPVLLRHANESLGVRRRISSAALPVFSIFGRAGTAMVVSISFIVILKSYSSLDVGIRDMIWLVGTSVVLSFLLGQFPTGGSYIALSAVCLLYGMGFESGYLILKPIAFFMGAVATTIDALVALAGTYIIGHRFDMAHQRELQFFI